ncbi:tetratricopeptide repeat protein [Legionella geestiana]|uniref:tetratricopeptide repeat protein n=1 Tax=Legionella geestiana TaxID=45065 RepID=UPI0010918A01|nr:tetratricopeptide repeat protein [Legionella geestiana]QDQ41019.1 tetratricopeptide repeat protein [Legionella geestiana]
MHPADYLRFLWLLILIVPGVALALSPLKLSRMRAFTSGAIITLLLFGAYYYVGGARDLLIDAKMRAEKASVEKLLGRLDGRDAVIQKLKNVLAQNPNSARGWYLLGRLYASGGEHKKAVRAFKKAQHLEPDDKGILLNLVHSEWQLAGQRLDTSGKNRLSALLQQTPDEPNALSLLAMDAFLRHDYETAIAYWDRLLPQLLPDSEEALHIRDARAKAQKALSMSVSTEETHERQSVSGD